MSGMVNARLGDWTEAGALQNMFWWQILLPVGICSDSATLPRKTARYHSIVFSSTSGNTARDASGRPPQPADIALMAMIRPDHRCEVPPEHTVAPSILLPLRHGIRHTTLTSRALSHAIEELETNSGRTESSGRLRSFKRMRKRLRHLLKSHPESIEANVW